MEANEHKKAKYLKLAEEGYVEGMGGWGFCRTVFTLDTQSWY